MTRIVRISLWQDGRETDVWAMDVGVEIVLLVYVGAEGHAARCCWVIIIQPVRLGLIVAYV